MRRPMTAVIARGMLETIVVSAAVIRLTVQRTDGRLHLGDIMRNGTLIPVRGPGEVREQDEEDECFGDTSAHTRDFTVLSLVFQSREVLISGVRIESQAAAETMHVLR